MARPKKYNDNLIISSVALPDELHNWLNEESRRQNISRNSLIVSYFYKIKRES